MTFYTELMNLKESSKSLDISEVLYEFLKKKTAEQNCSAALFALF
jgi:predicted CopG family antitoxin